MFYYYTNGSAFLAKMLDARYWYSKEQSCSQKTSNLASLSTKKRYMANKKILILTNIVMIVFSLLLILLYMINIMLQNY